MADADGWLDGWEIVNLDTGLSWTGGPGKLTVHTTEPVGATMGGLINTFKRNPTIASHVGICWKTMRKVQFISLLHSAKSLRNLAGGVETNRDQVYQIEIVGSWVESPNIPDAGLRFIGECIAEIWLAVGGAFKLQLGYKPLVGPEDGYTARVNAPQRYSAKEWDNFNGTAGHCNAPENEHTDPGKLNMGRIFHYAQLKINGSVYQPKPTLEEAMLKSLRNKDGRTELIKLDTDGYFYSSWQNHNNAGKLTPWGRVNSNQPGPFVDGDAYEHPDDGRLICVGLVNTQWGDIPFLSSQTAPSRGPWTEWVNLSELLSFLHQTA